MPQKGHIFIIPNGLSPRGRVRRVPRSRELERRYSHDRAPVDQLRELNMTHWEKLEFFIYKLSFDRIATNKSRDSK